MTTLAYLGLIWVLLALNLVALPFNEPLLDVYDYIIVGGGIAGLTVANRLSEDPNATILVLEAGPFDNYEQIVLVPVFVGADIYSPWDWYFETEPQTYLDGATRRIPQGRAVGGGSILNAMLWNRGNRGDYDDWASFGNPGWDWNGLLPYFQRSETYTPVSSPEIGDEFGIHYDPNVHGFNGPVNVSYQNYFYNTSLNFFSGLNALGIPTVFDPNDGAHAGATYLPLDISPKNQSRADARRSYYDPFADRQNWWVSTGRYVTQLVYEESGCATANAHAIPIPGDHGTGQGNGAGTGGNGANPAPGLAAPPPTKRQESNSSNVRVIGVEHASDAASPRVTTLARREVIMAAGALQSPKILELSGIGPSAILMQNNISTVLDLPGVGNNLQDHYLIGTYYQFFNQSYTYSNQLNLDPNNNTLNMLAEQQYYANRTGPWTAGPADGNAFPSLSQISTRAMEIVNNASSQSAGAHLAAGLDPTVIAGYVAQVNKSIAALADPERAVIELLNSNAGNLSPSVMRPLSRGSSHINSSQPFDPPRVDPRYGSNPIDIDVLVESLLFNRRLLAAPSMVELQPYQWAPPMEADDTALRMFINNGIGTEYHPSCTCAMLPLELGGVVDSNLLVYGTQNLRVVDASVFPTIPASHLQAVVYAVAEKASDIIRGANAGTTPPVLPNDSVCGNATTYTNTSIVLLPSSAVSTSISTASDTAILATTSIDLTPASSTVAISSPDTLVTSTKSLLPISAASGDRNFMVLNASSPAPTSSVPQQSLSTTMPAINNIGNIDIPFSSAVSNIHSTPPPPGPFAGYNPIPAALPTLSSITAAVTTPSDSSGSLMSTTTVQQPPSREDAPPSNEYEVAGRRLNARDIGRFLDWLRDVIASRRG